MPGAVEQLARVVQVEDDWVWVETTQQSACGTCSAGGVCGTSVISKLFPQRRQRFRLRNVIGARCGDYVAVGLEGRTLQFAAVLLYLVPLLGLIGGAMVGRQIGAVYADPDSAELMSIVAGLLGLSGGLYLSRWLTGHSGAIRDGQAKLLRIERTQVTITAPTIE